MINPVVDIIFGGQFGSEGKRLFNEYHYITEKPDAIISNFGPNSGGFVSDGGKWATFAMGADCVHMLSPGSIINVNDFYDEYSRLPKNSKVYIHQNACIVNEKSIKDEQRFVRVGSTMTGTAAAAIRKMDRDPSDGYIVGNIFPEFCVDARDWIDLVMSFKKIQLSVPQGHSLSINHGFHPYCTSRNTSPQQALADAGIPIQWVRKVIACMRTYPIRVANRYDETGEMVGFSGPCYRDQQELTWEQVGQKPEYTSVSKKVRRVFNFSMMQLRESCIMNGTTDVFLNFANYLNGVEMDMLFQAASNVCSHTGTNITWMGYGPTIHDIAKVKRISPTDEFDDRIGCHPTMVGIEHSYLKHNTTMDDEA